MWWYCVGVRVLSPVPLSFRSGMLDPPPPGTLSLLKMACRSGWLVTGSGHACADPMDSTHRVSRARCRIGKMSLVYEVVVGSVAIPLSTIAWNTRSYNVMTLSMSGANFGGAPTTHAPTTGGDALVARSVIVADTGPSDTSSYQSSLIQ